MKFNFIVHFLTFMSREAKIYEELVNDLWMSQGLIGDICFYHWMPSGLSD